MCAHVYIHVPFCSGKCGYCSFYSVQYERASVAAYLDALAREIEAYVRVNGKPELATIYLGGGTPGVLDAAQVGELCGLVRRDFGVGSLCEWTMEMNPGEVQAEKLVAAREQGVTRISMGVQSFDEASLGLLGRRHGVGDVEDSVRLVREAGFRELGLDLILCVPGLDRAGCRASLERAVDLEPEHISAYLLTVEAGTRLESLVAAGRVALPGEAEQIEAIEEAERVLTRAGYVRYEVSNYAVRGHECRHNLSFWRGGDYVGFGPAAASRVGRKRWQNLADLAGYVRAGLAGESPAREAEELGLDLDFAERCAFRFRTGEWVDVRGMAARWGVDGAVVDRIVAELAGWVDGGSLEKGAAGFRTTAKGFLAADRLAGVVLGCV